MLYSEIKKGYKHLQACMPWVKQHSRTLQTRMKQLRKQVNQPHRKTNDGSSNTSTSATENEKVEEKTDADKSTGEDPPATTETKQETGTSVNEETNKGNTDATKEETKTTTNEEKKADPIEMPAASFSASTSKLNISVSALANTFPKGTTMRAKEISASYAKSIAKEKLKRN